MQEINKMMMKHAMKGYLITGIILLAIGIGCASAGFRVLWKAGHVSQSVFSVGSDDLQNGNWYDGRNNLLLDWYGETEDGRYYVTVTGDKEPKYMGYYVPAAEINQAERIAEETRAMWFGKTKEYPKEYLNGIGYMADMTEDEKQCFDEYMAEGAKSDLSGYLVYRTFHKVSPWQAVKENGDDTMLYFGALMIVLAIFAFFYWIIGGYRFDVTKVMKQYGITEEMLASDMYYSRREKAVWFGEKYALFWRVFLTKLFQYDQLIWAYLKITSTRHTMYGIIPLGTSKSYELVIVDRDNKEKKIYVRTQQAGEDLLMQLTAMAPYIYSGYDESLMQARKNHFSEMIARVDEERQRRLTKDTLNTFPV